MPKSHRPLSPHPNAHSQTEIKWIADCCRRNPNFGPLKSILDCLSKSLIPIPIMAFTDVLSVFNKHFFIKSLKPKEKAPFIIHLTGLATRCN